MARVFSKLDRILANVAWQILFPTAELCFQNEREFDHSPPMLVVYLDTLNGLKPFKYYNVEDICIF